MGILMRLFFTVLSALKASSGQCVHYMFLPPAGKYFQNLPDNAPDIHLPQ
jgi:hypothetical protein